MHAPSAGWAGHIGVVATCDKFDNRLYVLKTGHQLETSLPINIPNF